MVDLLQIYFSIRRRITALSIWMQEIEDGPSPQGKAEGGDRLAGVRPNDPAFHKIHGLGLKGPMRSRGEFIGPLLDEGWRRLPRWVIWWGNPGAMMRASLAMG